jgi:hypothetical protein
MTLQQKIALTKQMLKIVPIKRNDKCKGYAPGCVACDMQLLKGHLYSF